jgi:spermidine dehydrogenase
MNRNDKKLGMDRDITRRDFLNGASIAISGSLFSGPLSAALADGNNAGAQMQPGYYPPTRTGMRGSHPGSFELAHLMRDGKRWDDPADSVDTGEQYDLVVVGGGISGLSAAYYYQKELGPGARILVVDNHDDFGGHAKRNEFEYGGRTLVDLGGTEFIENPGSYPAHARALIEDLGVDIGQAEAVFDHDLYPSLGLRGGVFFDKESFGKDATVAGREGLLRDEKQYGYITLPVELESGVGDRDDVAAFLDRAPLSAEVRQEILELYCGDEDHLAGKSLQQKIALLDSISYAEYLSTYVDAAPETLAFFRMWRTSYMGDATDAGSATDALRIGLPGAKGLGIVDHLSSTGYQPHRHKDDFHFPDGNASVARMLVRRLVPGVAPGHSMDDIVSARFDYNRLDVPESPVKIRLNSTAVHVQHVDSDAVEVTYVEDGQARRVQSKHCILACYHAIVPHICPELPTRQKEALSRTLRMPLVSINVLIDNWKAFENLGIYSAYSPGSFCCDMRLTRPLKFADYQSARSTDEATTVHLYRIPLPGSGLTPRERYRLGRHELLATTFETFERNIRDQLGRTLQAGGFDPARDIKGITVNRWPHGYAMGYDWEQEKVIWGSASEDVPDERKMWLAGRKKFRNIAFANTDAGATAMTEAAIEQAYRATRELLDDA